jgi:hypothetical protein
MRWEGVGKELADAVPARVLSWFRPSDPLRGLDARYREGSTLLSFWRIASIVASFTLPIETYQL